MDRLNSVEGALRVADAIRHRVYGSTIRLLKIPSTGRRDTAVPPAEPSDASTSSTAIGTAALAEHPNRCASLYRPAT
jgi:hypothetical protein